MAIEAIIVKIPAVVRHLQQINMKGQTLIEILLAFALLGIVMTGIVVSVISGLSNANFAKTQTQASQYAQEGIELLQGIRDSDYNSFRNFSGNYCLGGGATTLGAPSNCSYVNVGNFVRSVNIEQSACAPNVARATLTVAWSDGKCNSGAYCHKSQLISCLSTVNPIDLSSFSNSYSNAAAGPTPTTAAGPTPTTAAGPTSPPGATTIGLSISPNPAPTSDALIFTAPVTES